MENVNGSTTGANINQISIDSLKIRLPLDIITILNDDLKSYWYLVNGNSGEIDPKKYKENCYPYEDHGIKIKFAIEKQTIIDRETKDYLVILVSSKILKSKYFEGIREDNLKTVFEEIIGLKIVDFSFDDFINKSECTDCDFKKDIKVENLRVIIQDMITRTNPSKKKDEGYRSYNRKDNIGIEFSDRRTTAFKTNPFLKVYHKETELRMKSNDFAYTYLREINYSNLCRVEATVKNKKHFKYLGIENTSLKNLTSLNEDQKKNIIGMAVNFHLSREIKPPKKTDKFSSPDKILIYNAISFMIGQRINFDRILMYLLSGINNPVSRSRKKSEITEIYNSCVYGNEEDKTAEEINTFYDEIGLL